ncbi:unnamed protein product [Caenorhabditis bovis]|uniref:Uncharacterized protein n=1 Tax=Caenorhabditis bovis TaxID=2654633 RepID=A0A8S1EPK3_9PELO|nr:unnamed protein product [Caenorhabditis bovis]
MRRQILLLALLIGSSQASIQCKDNNNNPVDWFVFYKLPHLYNHNDNFPISNGTGFLYLDEFDTNWKLMDEGMDVENNAIFYTLQQYYKSDNNSVFSYLYNDEWPDSDIWSPTSGHAKGVSVFDRSTGFWMLHSIPKFPSVDEFRFPRNARWYGQMGVCISFPTLTLNDIALQLFYYNTFTYHINVPDYFANTVPLLNRLKNGDYQRNAPYTSIKILKSLDGKNFKHFAKTGNFGKDLYADLVVPEVRSSLKVEIWNHQSGNETNLPSQCNPNPHKSVLNGKYIRLPFNIYYSSYEDHSKFAVAYNEVFGQPPMPYVCIGDINRQSHQLYRGGGTMCFFDQNVYYTFSTMISETVPCPL